MCLCVLIAQKHRNNHIQYHHIRNQRNYRHGKALLPVAYPEQPQSDDCKKPDDVGNISRIAYNAFGYCNYVVVPKMVKSAKAFAAFLK